MKERASGLMNLLDLDKSGLESLMAELGRPAYRARPDIRLAAQKRATSLDEMTNLPAALRQKLAGMAHVGKLEVLRHQQAGDGTVKLLLELKDGETVETVFMVHRHGNSLCISTQVGCRMGCAFCASTLSGLARNLTPGEMLAQVYAAEAFTGKPVQSIVLMGMGEPLDNLDNVLAFLRLLSHPDGFGMSLRHVSLSTCGVVPGIRELARHKWGDLSVSLHAPTMRPAAPLCPSTANIPSPSCWLPAMITSKPPGGASPMNMLSSQGSTTMRLMPMPSAGC